MIYFGHFWSQFSQVINVMRVIWPVHLFTTFSVGLGALCLPEKSLFSHYNISRNGDHYTYFLGKQTKAQRN